MKKILVVEDERITSGIYINKFRQENFQAEPACDGEAALDMVASFRPDAVLLDLGLPKIDGVEVLKRLRAHPDFEKLPIVVFSNGYQKGLIEKAQHAGATTCLSKTRCSPKQVVEVVRAWMAKAEIAAAGDGPISVEKGAAPAPSSVNPKTASEFRAEIVGAFPEQAPQMTASMQSLWEKFLVTDGARPNRPLADLLQKTHVLTGNAAIAECAPVARLSGALELLLKKVSEKPDSVHASTLRTVTNAISFLDVLARRAGQPLPVNGMEQARILIVDDEPLSSKAIGSALEVVELNPTVADAPVQALRLLEKESYDLVLLDVRMRGMTGFELCERLRRLPGHQRTPVVFVTGLNDFDTRGRATLSGGNEVISKPFLLMELGVMALTYVLKARLHCTGAV